MKALGVKEATRCASQGLHMRLHGGSRVHYKAMHECKPVPSPPLAQTRARFWFQDQKCGNTGSPCLDKPVLARGTYYGTQVAGIAQP